MGWNSFFYTIFRGENSTRYKTRNDKEKNLHAEEIIKLHPKRKWNYSLPIMKRSKKNFIRKIKLSPTDLLYNNTLVPRISETLEKKTFF